MEHLCSVCGQPDESGHAAGMCCEGCTCTLDPNEPDDTGEEGDGGWEAFRSTWEPDNVWEARGEK